jgi:very-short-patch-repair endonuclease
MTMPGMIRSHVHRVARAQHHVVSAPQLREIGVDRCMSKRFVDAGELTIVIPRVYATRPAEELSLDGWAMAAALARRTPTVSSGLTAIIRHGAWDRGPEVVEASTCGTPCRIVAASAPGGALLLRRWHRPDRAETQLVRGVPTMSPVRACQDLGRSLTALQITFVLREFVRRRDFTIEEFQARVDAAGAIHGASCLRDAITWYHRKSAGTRGQNEDELCRLIHANGLPFPLVNVRGATGFADLECDFVWARQRVVVELNDRRHLLPGAADVDEKKRARLESAGWRIVFIPGWRVWNEPDRLMAEIRAMLAGAN